MFTKHMFRLITLVAGLVMLVGTASPAFAQGVSSRTEAGKGLVVKGTFDVSGSSSNAGSTGLNGDDHRSVLRGQLDAGVGGGTMSNVENDGSHRKIYRAVSGPPKVTRPPEGGVVVFPYVILARDY